jgi:beta-mannanase
VVDMVGVSVFGLQNYDVDKFGHARSFAEVLKPKYDRVLDFGKPIYVAELGYEGPISYVQDWQETVAVVNANFPELVGIVYYNHKEVYPWPENYGLPNWRVRR